MLSTSMDSCPSRTIIRVVRNAPIANALSAEAPCAANAAVISSEPSRTISAADFSLEPSLPAAPAGPTGPSLLSKESLPLQAASNTRADRTSAPAIIFLTTAAIRISHLSSEHKTSNPALRFPPSSIRSASGSPRTTSAYHSSSPRSPSPFSRWEKAEDEGVPCARPIDAANALPIACLTEPPSPRRTETSRMRDSASSPLEGSIDAVVFDYDDTLADTFPARVEAMRLTFDEAGLPYDPTEFVETMRGSPFRPAFDEMSDARGWELDLMDVYLRHYWSKGPGFVYLFDGVREMLDALKQRGMPMGILTSKTHDILVEGRRAGALVEVEELGIEGHFPHIVGFEDVTHHKPHPEGLERLIARIGATPTRTLVVGDSWSDVEVAKNGGCWSCLATWGLDDPTQQISRATPDFIAETPAQLLILLA